MPNDKKPQWVAELRFQDPRTECYVGGPTILRLPSGALLAALEYDGPGAPLDADGEEFASSIYRSEDDGSSWRDVLPITGALWSSLFLHGDAVHLIGVSAHDGSIVIRRSDDEGWTWSRPTSPGTGLLFAGGRGRRPPNYHCAPTPVLAHRGRVYRAFEDNDETLPFAGGFKALVISAAEDADLLDARSWTMSNKLPYDREADPDEFGRGVDGMPGWLEGNVVAGPDGALWDLMRVHAFPVLNKAALIRVEEEGRRIAFDPATGFVDMPGGGSKFTVRRDPVTGEYWALVNDMRGGERPIFRNRLSACRSPDLRSWRTVCTLLVDDVETDPAQSVRFTGFQYVDWQFDGEDIIYLVRAAYDGAHGWHDANRMVFGRLERFRLQGGG